MSAKYTIAAAPVAALALSFTSLRYSQSYLSKPIRFIAPFPPGGGHDLLARGLAQYLAELLGQPVPVENRPGASIILGTELAAKAPLDGHTIFMGNNSKVTINPKLMARASSAAHRRYSPKRSRRILCGGAASSNRPASCSTPRAELQPQTLSS